MAQTTIKLADGVTDGARHVEQLTLRPIGLLDIVSMGVLDLGKLSDSLRMISRLSGEPLDLLQWLTQDDVHAALLGLSAHLDQHMPRETR